MIEDSSASGAGPTEIREMCRGWAAPSRRGLMGAGAGLVAGEAAQLLAGEAAAAGATETFDQLKRAERDPNHRILLKGGMVLSLDPGVGDFEKGDVLIGGKKILAVGRDLNATDSLVDASAMIVMPGFVDTHHHQYETILRGILADGVLSSPNDGKKTYTSQVSHTPAHSDACIAGLKESGLRAVYTYSPGLGTGSQYPRTCSVCSRNTFHPPTSC